MPRSRDSLHRAPWHSALVLVELDVAVLVLLSQLDNFGNQ